MADLAVTNTFTTNTTISSSQVNTNFSDIVNYINLRNNGSANWTALAVTGNATIGGTLGVSGATTLSSTLVVTGSTSFATTLILGSSVTIGSYQARINSTGNLGLSIYSQTAASAAYLNLENDGANIWALSCKGTGTANPNQLVFDYNGTIRFAMTSAGVATFSGQLIGKGTATNDDAASGYIGEYISSSVTSTANMATSTQYGNITSISLTAGDWDVIGAAFFDANGATVTAGYATAISVNSGNTTSDHVDGDNVLYGTPSGLAKHASTTIVYRLSLSGTTTVYLKTATTYSGGPPKTAGTIKARRRR